MKTEWAVISRFMLGAIVQVDVFPTEKQAFDWAAWRLKTRWEVLAVLGSSGGDGRRRNEVETLPV